MHEYEGIKRSDTMGEDAGNQSDEDLSDYDNDNLSDQDDEEIGDKDNSKEIQIHEGLEKLVATIKRGDAEPLDEYLEHNTELVEISQEQSETTKECILHFLLKETYNKNNDQKDRIGKAIRHFADKYPNLLRVRNGDEQTPLYYALANMNPNRAQLLLIGLLKQQNKMSQDVQKQISLAIDDRCGSLNENCLHRAAQMNPLNTGVLERLVNFATPSAINARDNAKATPLHRAVKFENSNAKMLDIIRKMIKKSERKRSTDTREIDRRNYAFDLRLNPGKESLSVFEYHKKTHDDYFFKQSEPTSNSKKNPVKPSEEPKSSPLKQVTEIGQQGRGNEDPKFRPNALAMNHKASVKRDTLTQDGCASIKETKGLREKLSETGAQQSTTSKSNMSKARASERSVVDQKAKEEDLKKWSEEICNELKLHCLRTRTIDQAKKFLYGTKGDGPQLSFNYEGLVTKDVNPVTFFNNFKQTKFDSILQYVVFPAITLKKDKEILPPCGFFRSYEELYKSNTIGRNDFLFFFAWLSTEKGVKQIIKLVVDDFENPHSDDIIEKCLSLFDIDVLNWSKADLDPEILCTACPRVREIQLRWGGNNAILRAWSERDGLPRLKDLQKITLDYDEVSDRVNRQVENFRTRLGSVLSESSTDEGKSKVRSIEVSSITGSQRLGQNSHSGTLCATNKPLDGSAHKWLDTIDEFASEFNNFLIRIKDKRHEDDEVKVALIDDGVNMDEKSFGGRIISGKTFGYHSSNFREKQWYVSDTGHGTAMAHMILRVCPMAKIYPIKLNTTDDLQGGPVRIQPESAIEAIEAAIDQKVNIISMSWTVNQPDDNNTKRAFDAALSKATEAGILMFCSSPDKGQFHDKTYPVAHGPDKFFRIGAAQADGNPSGWVFPGQVDYIFPGVDVVRAKSRDITLKGVDDQGETGSSISTALAAGLAALVICFIKIEIAYSLENQDPQGHVGRLDGLENHDLKTVQEVEGMKYAFTQLGADQGQNKKYVEIWSSLEKRTGALKDLRGNPEKARKEICQLARNLVKK